MNSFFNLNIGHVITIVGGIISLAIVWQKMRGQLDTLSERLKEQRVETEPFTRMGLVTTIAQHERRIQELELAVKQLGVIETDLRWIKERLKQQ